MIAIVTGYNSQYSSYRDCVTHKTHQTTTSCTWPIIPGACLQYQSYNAVQILPVCSPRAEQTFLQKSLVKIVSKFLAVPVSGT